MTARHVFNWLSAILVIALLFVLTWHGARRSSTQMRLARAEDPSPLPDQPAMTPTASGPRSAVLSSPNSSMTPTNLDLIHFLVADVRDVPIAAAAYLLSAGGLHLLATTNSMGVFDCRLDVLTRDEKAMLFVKAEGYCSNCYPVMVMLPKWRKTNPNILRAMSAARITGRVLTRDNRAVMLGTAVAAMGRNERFPRDICARIGSGDPGVAITTTNEDGSFTLDGLDPRYPQYVAAGGNGLACVRPVLAFPNTEATLYVDPLCCVVLRVQDSIGGPPRVDAQAFGVLAHVEYPENIGSRKAPDWVLCLLGIDLASLSLGPFEALIALAAEPDQDRLGPMSYSLDVPGYAASTSEFFACALTSGIHEETMVLRADNTFGTINVRFADWHKDSELLSDTARPSCVLELNNGPKTWSYGVEHMEGVHAVNSVPQGSYFATLRSLTSDWQYPPVDEEPARLVVGENPVTIEVPVTFGRLSATIWDEENRCEYLGPAVLVVGQEGSFHEIDYYQAPYTVEGLHVGEHLVAFRLPKARPTNVTCSVVVAAGGVATAECVLTSRGH